MPGKEPMDLASFSESDYAANLEDKEGYSPATAKMLAKKKKESLANAATKIEIDLGSLAKDDEEIEHLSPEERKKRQAERDKRQKERAAHRAARRKLHDDVESGIPEGQ